MGVLQHPKHTPVYATAIAIGINYSERVDSLAMQSHIRKGPIMQRFISYSVQF